MNYFLNALKKYAVFSGRAQRAEYWYFVLFSVIIQIVINILGIVVGSNIAMTLVAIFCLAIIVPSLAVIVRRLHDINKSGWWIFISLIPLVGPIWLLVLMVLDSTPGTNQYGPNPKEAIPTVTTA